MPADDPRCRWTMIARPSEDGAGWDTVEVQATSAIQAAAIVRRQGMIVLEESVCRVGAPHAELGLYRVRSTAIRCGHCGYPLRGQTLRERGAVCSECGQFQLLFTRPLTPTDRRFDLTGGMGCLIAVVVLLAIIGLLTVLSILSFLI